MNMKHEDAIELEHMVCDTLKTDFNGYGGLVSAGNFDDHPMEAAIFCIVSLYHENQENRNAVDEFVSYWHTIFDYPKENKGHTSAEFVKSLKELITTLSKE